MKKIIEILVFFCFISLAASGGYFLCKNAHHYCKKQTNSYKDYRFCLGV